MRTATRGFNFRHAAALALVGWYLLIPPIQLAPLPQQPPLPGFNCVSGHPNCPNATEKGINLLLDKGLWILRPAHLNEWETVSVFDSAFLCNHAQGVVSDEADKLLKGNRFGFKAGRALSRTYARCIASDDPRLKGK